MKLHIRDLGTSIVTNHLFFIELRGVLQRYRAALSLPETHLPLSKEIRALLMLQAATQLCAGYSGASSYSSEALYEAIGCHAGELFEWDHPRYAELLKRVSLCESESPDFKLLVQHYLKKGGDQTKIPACYDR
jgi:hypothetical protein